MAIDPYSLCPGGLGKKVKFCCADLVTDLDKIDRLREADQRAACLDYIEKLEARHPERACLTTAKADLLRDLGRTQEADTALQGLLNQETANPIALAEAALLACEEEDAKRAMALVQRALGARQNPMPDKLVEALRVTAMALLGSNEFVAGRQLLQVYVDLLPQDRQGQVALSNLDRSPAIPLLLKENWSPEPAADDAPWKSLYTAALLPLRYIDWASAASEMAVVSKHYPQSPQVWKTLAILRMWLADAPGATEAWRTYVALDIPLEDAVEAEGVAQLIDPEAPDFVDLVQIEYQVHDLERVQEVLAGSPRCVILKAPPTALAEGAPPPRAMCLLLDRPKAAEDAPLDAETTPRVLGQLLIFGRETDREPRLQVSTYRNCSLEACQALLADLTFGLLGPAQEPVAMERVAVPVVELELRWYLPTPPSADEMQALRVKHRNEYLSQRWAKSPQELLQGKSPEQAAAIASLRIPLLAALLRLETQIEQAAAEFDFDALRQRLNLPVPATIELAELDDVPVARVARINLEPLDEPTVAKVAIRALMDGLVKATRRTMQEVLRRTVDKRSIPEALCYQYLAISEEDTRRKLELLEQASRRMMEAKVSCAAVDIQRLQLLVMRQEQAQSLELIVHLIDTHLNDPQYGPAVIETLAGFGLVRPDGKIMRPRLDRAAHVAGGLSEPGKIWTPDADRPANKPALWVPGS